MDQRFFFAVFFCIAVMALSGLKEIVPRTRKIGNQTERYRGDRRFGVAMLAAASIVSFILAVKAGWIHLPGIVP